MSTHKVDEEASKGRAQLANRMRTTILQACGGMASRESPSNDTVADSNNIELGNTSEVYNVSILSNDTLLNDNIKSIPSPLEGTVLLHDNITLPINDTLPVIDTGQDKSSFNSNDTLLSTNSSTDNELLHCNDILPINDTLLSNDTTQYIDASPSHNTTGNATILSNESIGNESLPNITLDPIRAFPSNDSLPNGSYTNMLVNTLPSNNSIPDKSLSSNNSLPANPLSGNGSLPTKPSPIYGAPIPEELFYPVLNMGVYSLLTGDNASASMLFYWAFTTQKSNILAVTYSLILKELGYSKPRISRTLDHIRGNSLFTVKSTMKGVFIDISQLLDEAKKVYSYSIDSGSNGSLLVLKTIESTELRILTDLLIFYGYTSKDISPKLISVMGDCYKNRGLESIVYNLAYASKNKKRVGSPTGYLLKTLTEDYGSTSLPYEDRSKAKSLIEVFRIIRNECFEDYGTAELKKWLLTLGKGTYDMQPRHECEKLIKEIMARSDEIFKNLSDNGDHTNRGNQLEFSKSLPWMK